MPRAALLSLHARVSGLDAESWKDASLVQLWGPRYSLYTVAAQDAAVFSLGRMPDSGPRRERAVRMAEKLNAALRGRRMPFGQAARAAGIGAANSLRYATTTGTVRLRWEGARDPEIWTVPAPAMDPFLARLELARRYLHIFGPSTSAGFADWAGVNIREARAAFDALAPELIPVRTPRNDGFLLASDEPLWAEAGGPEAPARLLPSGDAYFLLWGAERELLVPDARRREQLWTSRVWPGALLVGGEIAGVWRRSGGDVSITAWRKLSAPERAAIEAEAAALPLAERISVRWA